MRIVPNYSKNNSMIMFDDNERLCSQEFLLSKFYYSSCAVTLCYILQHHVSTIIIYSNYNKFYNFSCWLN